MPDFKPTLNLPDPAKTIPMKADLPRLEPQIQAKWAEERLYHRILDAHRNDPLFILHDGPPYTNSPIHIGTALNKVLKDVVIKSRAMMGFRAPYIPGFDNHGLPIEQAVAKRFAEENREPSREEFLQGCRDHAAHYISVQTEQFRRLGVLGLWEDPYATMDFRFEAGVIRVFKRLVEGGYLYRGLRPTLWSPSLRSALADTEIVYRTVTSKAIYVAFPVMNDPNEVLTRFPGVRAVIWTTTPWTIPANLAIALHPTFRYAVVRVGSEHYVVARELVEA
ncbi:MAG: isoleucine--tRNA ligase, partial [Armatimonadota bacterium]